MQIKAEVALVVFYIEGNRKPLEEPLVNVFSNLATTVVSVGAEIPTLSSVGQKMSKPFVVGEAVKTELKFDSKVIPSHFEYQLEGLQVLHAVPATFNY